MRVGSVIPIEICRQVRTMKNDPHQWKYLCIEGEKKHLFIEIYLPLQFIIIFYNKVPFYYRVKQLKMPIYFLFFLLLISLVDVRSCCFRKHFCFGEKLCNNLVWV